MKKRVVEIDIVGEMSDKEAQNIVQAFVSSIENTFKSFEVYGGTMSLKGFTLTHPAPKEFSFSDEKREFKHQKYLAKKDFKRQESHQNTTIINEVSGEMTPELVEALIGLHLKKNLVESQR